MINKCRINIKRSIIIKFILFIKFNFIEDFNIFTLYFMINKQIINLFLLQL
jgi:hypothetical protein